MNNELTMNYELPTTSYANRLSSPACQQRTTNYELSTNTNKPNLLNAQMNVNKVLTKHYENARLRGREKNKPKQTQSEILNQKSQIHSHPAGNKLHTPRRQSWGCFDLSGRATPKTAGLAFSLVALRYYCRTTDKI
ncbi:MAG TPA: hypothetical protein VMY06_09620 [Sedimentisphaerales bacterium]|nr:hypothetical protein [Sedimentisphaerales bacterium]